MKRLTRSGERGRGCGIRKKKWINSSIKTKEKKGRRREARRGKEL